MNHDSRGALPRWSHYLIPIVLCALTVLLRIYLNPLLGDTGPYFLASIVVTISAYTGGLWPGLFATAISTVAGTFLFIRPNSASLEDPKLRLIFGTQVAVCVCISIICGALRASQLESAKNAESEREARAKLDVLLTSITDKLLVLTKSLSLVSYNTAAGERWGLGPDAIGKSVESVLPKPLTQTLIPVLLQTVQSGAVSGIQARDDGSNRTYEVRAFPSPDGLLVYFHNITEQKETEEQLRLSEFRFRNLSNNSPMMIWVCNPDGSANWFNQPWLDFRKLTLNEALKEGCFSHIHEEDEPWVEEIRNRAFSAGEPFTAEFRSMAADGEYRWIMVKANPVHDSEGKLTTFLMSCQDVTDRISMEESLRRSLANERAARSDAEEANRLKDHFLASLSHELRTPLTTMLGWSELLTKTKPSQQEVTEGLQIIERSSKMQLQLINDLLDMSRISMGKIIVELEYAELFDTVQSVVDMVRGSATEKQIEISVKELDDPVIVRIDPDRFPQIIWNLLSNAIKFTPNGGTITVSMGLQGDKAEVRVADTGVGIEESFLPFVFERFRQADASRSRRHGGLGLGLSIAKQLAGLHGGDIRVESDGPNKGSTFIVTIPITTSVPEGRPLSKPRTEEAEDSRRLVDVRVQLVEDDDSSRDVLKRIMESEGAIVAAAGTASEARKLLRAASPDVLVSDIGLPDEDGYQLMRSIRNSNVADSNRIPSIALTAFAGSDDRMRAFEAGFNAYLTKPVEADDLIRAILELRSEAIDPD